MIEQYIRTLWIPLLEKPDALKALRFWELTVNKICLQEFKLCFIFDEFDHVYKKLPVQVFSHLRAMRDTNKVNVCYALFLRNLPETLRPSLENESFFELISRNLIGIKPYLPRDTIDMISKLEKRRNHPIQYKSTRDKIHDLSGGHPGIIQAIFSILTEHAENDPHVFDEGWLMRQESIKDECRKLFRSLEDNEQIRITEFAQGYFSKLSASDYKILRTKGLLVANGEKIRLFSPLFDLYLKQINIDALKESLNNHPKERSR
jgi:hypothetical protein